MKLPSLALCALAGALSLLPLAAQALGRQSFVVPDRPTAQGVALLREGRAAPIYLDGADHAGVLRAAGDLQEDIEKVGAVRPALLRDARPAGADVILVGTVGKSALIDQLGAAGKIDLAPLRGKWEGFLIQVVEQPMPGVARALVVAGSDKRGTIYGIYELSEQIGVSPWNWWADVPPPRHQSLVASSSTKVNDAPAVQFRGIFLNDEAPSLSNWSKERFGGYNHKFYEKVFELILRMRGNYLWPAMWGSAFFDDDKLNGKLADEYGIVMGTSHHEPMMRAQQEWGRYGNKGAWDYAKNETALQQFWRDSLRDRRDYEKVITIGMRGDGDEPMSRENNIALLEKIVKDQRDIIGAELGKDPAKVPQVWALYKEVQGYYEQGMRVPDDVILLWCDDNWGNIRRLPTAEERKRPGGAGVYYHFDYVGGPRSYKWLNVTPIPKVWEQMHLAWEYDARKMWIVNVGDLKPMEVPIEFFLTYAWDPKAWPAERLPEYLRAWAAREFGAEYASETADIVSRYTQYNGRRKPEQLEPAIYSYANYNEAARVVADYNALAERAIAMSARLPAEKRDAFFELVLHPVRASATVNELYAITYLNRLYAQQGRAATNDMAARVKQLFALDAELSRQYHQDIAGGKWNHMMSQTHIGYTSWDQPKVNVMPAVREISVPQAASMAVAVEGSEQVAQGGGTLSTPSLSVFARQSRFIELFNRGQQPYQFTVKADQPWITLSEAAGSVGQQKKITIDAHWDQVPLDAPPALLTITGPDQQQVSVRVPIQNPNALRPQNAHGHVETDGVVAIEAEHFSKAVAPVGRAWVRIPGHGRTLSGMSAAPVIGPPAEYKDGMRLEYQVNLFNAGKVQLEVTLAPTLKFQPGRGFRYAVSFDDEPLQTIDVHADASNKFWEKIVSNGAATSGSTHQLQKPGPHTLKFWVIDPGLVLQKLVINTGGLKPSYLGPPESPRFK
ncbi:MAG: glycosyl hydrolase 115 family protein [Massilia sp.]